MLAKSPRKHTSLLHHHASRLRRSGLPSPRQCWEKNTGLSFRRPINRSCTLRMIVKACMFECVLRSMLEDRRWLRDNMIVRGRMTRGCAVKAFCLYIGGNRLGLERVPRLKRGMRVVPMRGPMLRGNLTHYVWVLIRNRVKGIGTRMRGSRRNGSVVTAAPCYSNIIARIDSSYALLNKWLLYTDRFSAQRTCPCFPIQCSAHLTPSYSPYICVHTISERRKRHISYSNVVLIKISMKVTIDE